MPKPRMHTIILPKNHKPNLKESKHIQIENHKNATFIHLTEEAEKNKQIEKLKQEIEKNLEKHIEKPNEFTKEYFKLNNKTTLDAAKDHYNKLLNILIDLKEEITPRKILLAKKEIKILKEINKTLKNKQLDNKLNLFLEFLEKNNHKKIDITKEKDAERLLEFNHENYNVKEHIEKLKKDLNSKEQKRTNLERRIIPRMTNHLDQRYGEKGTFKYIAHKLNEKIPKVVKKYLYSTPNDKIIEKIKEDLFSDNETKENLEKLLIEPNVDPESRLLNSTGFKNKIKEFLENTDKVHLFFMDLNKLKQSNNIDYKLGDYLINSMSIALQKTVKELINEGIIKSEEDIILKRNHGSDEFLFLFKSDLNLNHNAIANIISKIKTNLKHIWDNIETILKKEGFDVSLDANTSIGYQNLIFEKDLDLDSKKEMLTSSIKKADELSIIEKKISKLKNKKEILKELDAITDDEFKKILNELKDFYLNTKEKKEYFKKGKIPNINPFSLFKEHLINLIKTDKDVDKLVRRIINIFTLNNEEKANQLIEETFAEYLANAEEDPLTHLYNKIGFEERIIEALKHHTEGHLIFIDINALKAANDRSKGGHETGDLFITTFAEALIETIKEENINAILGAFGGDEFVIYIGEHNNYETVKGENININKIYKIITQKLTQKFKQKWHAKKRSYEINNEELLEIPATFAAGMANINEIEREKRTTNPKNAFNELLKTAENRMKYNKTKRKEKDLILQALSEREINDYFNARIFVRFKELFGKKLNHKLLIKYIQKHTKKETISFNNPKLEFKFYINNKAIIKEELYEKINNTIKNQIRSILDPLNEEINFESILPGILENIITNFKLNLDVEIINTKTKEKWIDKNFNEIIKESILHTIRENIYKMISNANLRFDAKQIFEKNNPDIELQYKLYKLESYFYNILNYLSKNKINLDVKIYFEEMIKDKNLEAIPVEFFLPETASDKEEKVMTAIKTFLSNREWYK